MAPRLVMCVPLALVAATLVLTPPTQAVPVQRYASPTGTSAQDCSTPAQACNIGKAVNEAVTGQEVILAAGAYAPGAALETNAGVTIRGASAADRPVITASSNNGLFLGGTSPVVVRDLEIVHSGVNIGLLVFNPGIVERVSVRSSGVAACGASYAALLRDSLCVGTGTVGAGISATIGASGPVTYTAKLRNVTAIATGVSGHGIYLSMNGPVTYQLDLRNVIAQGATDISRHAVSGATSTVTAASSNYAVVDESGAGSLTPAGTNGNQSADPVFADTVLYRQSPASPTVDAGTPGADLGSTDLHGTPRVVGSAPDIGAHEVPDTTPPDTTLTKKPRKKTFARKAKFTFASSEPGSTFRCQLDTKPVRSCTSPFKKRKVKYGKHVFRVWAVDAAGNVDPTPAKYSWKVRRRD